jgi:hypothetical protein
MGYESKILFGQRKIKKENLNLNENEIQEKFKKIITTTDAEFGLNHLKKQLKDIEIAIKYDSKNQDYLNIRKNILEGIKKGETSISNVKTLK